MENKVTAQFIQNYEFKAKIEMDIEAHVTVLDKKQGGMETSCKKCETVQKGIFKPRFTRAYQEERFRDILKVTDKLKTDFLENNSQINDFVDIAQLKMGDEF